MAPSRENLPLTSIRGLAAVWVVADHVQSVWFVDCGAGLAAALAMGATAVDLFFVLSGFILTHVYGVLRLHQTPVFWLRRICRVYPLHLTVMAAIGVLVLSASALHRSANPHDWASFGVVVLLLQSFLLNETPWNPPSWSVGVELLCYAVFPLTLWLTRHLSVLLLACIATVLALTELWVVHKFGGATVGTGAVLRGLVGFHSGVALSLLRPCLPMRLASGVAPAGCASIIVAIYAGSPVAVVSAGAAMICALASEHGLAARAFCWAPLVWLGRVSFSIYMLHSQVQIVVDRAFSRLVGHWYMLAIFVAILLPLSQATYRFIEQPGRRLPALIAAKMRRRRRTAFVGRP